MELRSFHFSDHIGHFWQLQLSKNEKKKEK